MQHQNSKIDTKRLGEPSDQIQCKMVIQMLKFKYADSETMAGLMERLSSRATNATDDAGIPSLQPFYWKVYSSWARSQFSHLEFDPDGVTAHILEPCRHSILLQQPHKKEIGARWLYQRVEVGVKDL